MTFVPSLECSAKTKGLKDGRTIFRLPKGIDKHVERTKKGLEKQKLLKKDKGLFYEYQ